MKPGRIASPAAAWRGLALGLALGLAAAHAPADPMRPLEGAASTATEAGAAPDSPAPDTPPAARLSATRRDAAGRWEALIGTQWLRPGDRLDGARVQEVGANHVLLLRGSQRETVYLLTPLQPSRPTTPTGATPATAHLH